MRIVSLLPSATEIVCALGLEEHLVGISHDCDWPPGVAESRPVLSEPAVPTEAPSAEIDQAVRARLHQGRSVYHLDPDELDALAPDLILTQELCEVCAPAFSEVETAVRRLAGSPELISLEPGSLPDVLETIRTVGRATDCADRAAELCERLDDRIERVRERCQDAADRPRTLAIEWLEPLFVGGHWVPEMIELAGGEPLNGPGEPSVAIEWPDAAAFDPDVIALMPCGFTPERTLQELDVLASEPTWHDLRAVQHDRVALVHGSFYFNRPGPRLVTGLEILARLIHPERTDDIPLPSDAMRPLPSMEELEW